LLVRAGTYDQNIDYVWSSSNPIFSWESGSPSAYTTIKAESGPGTVIIAPTGLGPGSNTIIDVAIIGAGTGLNQSYYCFDGLILDTVNIPDGVTVAGIATSGGVVRVQNCEIRSTHTKHGQNLVNGSGGDAVGIAPGGPMEVLNTSIHGWGWPRDARVGPNGYIDGYDHGIYWQSTQGALIVKNCSFYDNSGYGVHYTGDNSVIANSRFWNNTSGGILTSSACQIYNNLIFDDGTVVAGDGPVGVFLSGSGSVVYNNTMFNLAHMGVYAQWGGQTIRNNIVFQSRYDIYEETPGTSTIDPNLGSANNPNFLSTDRMNPDFLRIGAGPAVGAGANLYDNPPGLNTDYSGPLSDTQPFSYAWGNPRPATGAWDLGAYQSGGNTGPRPTPLPNPTPVPGPNPTPAGGREGKNGDASINDSLCGALGMESILVLGVAWLRRRRLRRRPLAP
jgi:hypothetical protein